MPEVLWVSLDSQHAGGRLLFSAMFAVTFSIVVL